jgi:hypothetical protein
MVRLFWSPKHWSSEHILHHAICHLKVFHLSELIKDPRHTVHTQWKCWLSYSSPTYTESSTLLVGFSFKILSNDKFIPSSSSKEGLCTFHPLPPMVTFYIIIVQYQTRNLTLVQPVRTGFCHFIKNVDLCNHHTLDREQFCPLNIPFIVTLSTTTTTISTYHSPNTR